MYDVLNHIEVTPKCKLCDNDLRFIGLDRGYGIYCSKSCQLLGLHDKQRADGWSFKQEHVLEQMKQNNIERYGVEFPFQSREYQNMMEEKCYERLGVKKASQLKEVSDKISETLLNLDSGTWSEIISKRKCASIEKYGVGSYTKTSEYKIKHKETCNRKYGAEHWMQTEEYKLLFSKLISKSKVDFYKKVRNEDGTDNKGVVYVVEFEHYIKIGMSSDFETRKQGLLNDFGPFTVLKLINTDTCYKLESTLHKICEQYNIILESGCGRTEFFTKEILNIKELQEWLK